MSQQPDLTGYEPRIGAASPAGDAGHALTGLEPQLGGLHRARTDPHLVAQALATNTAEEREQVVHLIEVTGQSRVYARDLAEHASPYARRLVAGVWQRRYSRRQRVNAVAVVGMLGQATRDVIKPLFAALGGKDSVVQRAVIIALSDLWHMDDLWLLTHQDALRRQQAAENLGRQRDPRAIGPLLITVHDEDHYVRAAIAYALGQLAAYHAIDDLIELLNDPEFLVRRAAAEALATISESLTPGDDNAQSVVEPMLRVLRTGGWAERQAAAQALGHLGDAERAVEPLLAALRDRDRMVREAAARALGVLRDPRAFQPLLELLDDVYLAVARAAVSALGDLGDPRAVSHLLLLLGDDLDLCLPAAHALGAIRDDSAVEPLAAIARSDEHRFATRQAALIALREIGTASARVALDEFASRAGT